MIEIKDQMNFTIRLEKFPERIVSLVPSQTELLFSFGLDKKVAGITKFCIHPDEWYKNKTRAGGTKNVNFDIIEKIKPDLIIGNKEENSLHDILKLKEKYPVYMSDIFNAEDAYKMIDDIGTLTNSQPVAKNLINDIQKSVVQFPKLNKKVLYLIWADPFMAAGNKTFIGDILKKLGLRNVLEDENLRYIELSAETISELKPELIILSSEPFPFKDEHKRTLRKTSDAQIIFADGEMFSWYGSRMMLMNTYFQQLAKEINR